MDNYVKGKNVEQPVERDTVPIPNLPPDFLWMRVRGGSKIRNLLSHALGEFPNARAVVWTGTGQAVGKTVTCAELMKRECGNHLHQITKLGYQVVEEFWDPAVPDLDQLVVKRNLPVVHVCLSAEPLDSAELGYQGPRDIVAFNRAPGAQKRGPKAENGRSQAGKEAG